MTSNGKVVSHAELAEAIWGDTYLKASDNLRVYIRRLRKKMGIDPKFANAIVTKLGTGYFLRVQ
jgi:two-component system KDP operon response regulator KdpE